MNNKTLCYILISYCFISVHAFANNDSSYIKGKNYFYSGYYQNSISELLKCVNDTSLKDCNYLIGLSYLNLKQYSAAINYFKTEVARHSNNANAYMQLAKCYSNKGKYSKANKYYNNLLKKQPQYYLAVFEKGNILYKRKKYNKAIKLFEQVLEEDRSFENALYKIGFCYYEKNKIVQACDYWKKIEDLDDFENYQLIEKTIAMHKK